MKYKKWWMPVVFMAVSAAILALAFGINMSITEDNSMTNHIYFLISFSIWLFLAVPVLSLIYARRVLAGARERILLTLYNSVMLVLPLVFLLFINLDSWLTLLLLFIWAEMWALLGLAGRGEKRADVWYVPLFFGLALIIVDMYLDYLIAGYLMTAIISCIVCPIAILLYTRICVRDREGRVFYSVYVSLAMLISVFGSIVWPIIEGETLLEDPVFDIVKLCLAAIGTFVVYGFVALLGAGVKIKSPKRKKKARSEEENGSVEVTEETKE